MGDKAMISIKDKADLEAHLDQAGDRLVVIDFYATWCGPCKLIAPKLETMASTTYKDTVVFLKVDVDENEDIAGEYGVSAMPTFILIKNKTKVDEFAGANEPKLNELIEKYK